MCDGKPPNNILKCNQMKDVDSGPKGCPQYAYLAATTKLGHLLHHKAASLSRWLTHLRSSFVLAFARVAHWLQIRYL